MTQFPSVILRRPEVERLVGVSRATLYKWLRSGVFPAPVRLGPRAVGWRRPDVERWLAERPAVTYTEPPTNSGRAA